MKRWNLLPSAASAAARLRGPGPVLLAGLLVLSSACGPTGHSQPERAAPRRTAVRVGMSAPIEMYNEAGRGEVRVPVPRQAVWDVLEGVYAQLEIPLNRRDHRVFEIGNLGFEARRIEGKRMNTWVDCGSNLSGNLANQYEVTLYVVTRLTEEEGTTVIATTVDARGEPRATSGNEVHCQSRETLEKRVGELAAGRLGIGM